MRCTYNQIKDEWKNPNGGSLLELSSVSLEACLYVLRRLWINVRLSANHVRCTALGITEGWRTRTELGFVCVMGFAGLADEFVLVVSLDKLFPVGMGTTIRLGECEGI
jgi:hypothetical protein